MTNNTSIELSDLQTLLTGQIIVRGDSRYDTARTVLADPGDSRPLAVARVRSAQDVAEVIRFARRHDLPLAVRSGGHSGAGHGTVDGGIVIDLRELAGIVVDAETSAVWVGGGATAGAVLEAAAEHGLVVPFGDAASVGVGGLTTGGGVGYLSRQYGLTIDSLAAAEMVLADGRIVVTDQTQEPDLFWAIRGGGGNFGVVTRFLFRAIPLIEVTGGMLVLPATAATIAGFARAAENAPETLGTIATIMPAFPAPFIPEAHRGRPIILANIAYSGPAEEADRVLAPFRALAAPFLDTVKRGPFLDLYPKEELPPPGRPEQDTMFIGGIDEVVAQRIVDALESSDSIVRLVQIRVLGGAASRVPVDATAYAHRRSSILLYMVNFWTTEEERARRRRWLADLRVALDQGDNGAYANFLGAEPRIGSAYPGATGERLSRIKQHYDPDNLFRRNHNIVPSGQ